MTSHRIGSLLALALIAGLLSACSLSGAVDRELGQHTSTARTTATLTPTVVPERVVIEMDSDGSRVLSAPAPVAQPEAPGEQTLVMAGAGDGPATLDPALVRDAESAFLARQIFRGLVKLDDRLQPEPDIASRIEISPDGLRYTFHLRDNAVFHNGKPIDAGAVAASLNRAAEPLLAGGDGLALPAALYLIDIVGAEERLRGAAETISGVRVVDPRTLETTLRRPVANFLYKLAGSPALIVDVETISGDRWWSDPNGSGPFVLETFDESEVVLGRFERFYTGAPALRQVRIRLGAAAWQPMNLYESGDIDIASVPFDTIDRIMSDSDPLHDDLVVAPQLSTTFIFMSPRHEPFDDHAVRLAIARSLDRSKVSSVMLENRVELAEGIIPPGMLDRSWPSSPIRHSISGAREALDSAAPFDVPPAFFEGGAAARLASILRDDLDIEAEAIMIDWDQFTALLGDQSLPAFELTWIADYPDPANFLQSLFHSRSPDNYIGYTNAEVDRLLDEAEVEPDMERRAELYRTAQQLIIDDAVVIPLYHDVSYTVVKPHVRGLTISPIGILSLEDVWIDTR